MPQFSYRAIGRDGKSHEGWIDADGMELASRQLRAQGLTLLKLEPGAGTAGSTRRAGGKVLPVGEIAFGEKVSQDMEVGVLGAHPGAEQQVGVQQELLEGAVHPDAEVGNPVDLLVFDDDHALLELHRRVPEAVDRVESRASPGAPLVPVVLVTDDAVASCLHRACIQVG